MQDFEFEYEVDSNGATAAFSENREKAIKCAREWSEINGSATLLDRVEGKTYHFCMGYCTDLDEVISSGEVIYQEDSEDIFAPLFMED